LRALLVGSELSACSIRRILLADVGAKAARRASDKQARTSRHSHVHPPSPEELHRQVERQQCEIEKLRKLVIERDRQIADAESGSPIWNGNWPRARRILPILPNHLLPAAGRKAETARPRAQEQAQAGEHVPGRHRPLPRRSKAQQFSPPASGRGGFE
jgi:hypothetical protein